MFDWDKLKIKEPRSAEEIYAEAEERRKIIMKIKERSKTNDKDNRK